MSACTYPLREFPQRFLYRMGCQPDTQRLAHLGNRLETRMATRLQGFVERFTVDASGFSNLRHTTGTGYGAQGANEFARVVFLKRHRQVRGNSFRGFEEFSDFDGFGHRLIVAIQLQADHLTGLFRQRRLMSVTAKSVTGRRNPFSRRRTSARQALFCCLSNLYGGRYGEAFGLAGVLLGRSSYPRIVRHHSCRKDCGGLLSQEGVRYVH